MAATVGQQLTSPESGMTRYDDTNANFSFLGTWLDLHANYTGHYNGTICTSAANSDAKVRFNASGTTRLSLIGCGYDNRANNISLSIDGVIVTTFSQVTSVLTYQILFCAKSELSTGEHYVEVWNTTGAGPMTFDAIDIDSGGTLKPYNEHITKAQFLSGGM